MKLVFIAPFLGLLWGCQSILKDQPAILAESTPESSLQIKTIIEQALNSNNVLIGQSAFTKSSQLIIQRKISNSSASPKFLSETEKPYYFRLFKNSTGCFIKYETHRWYLRNTVCVAD
jgi:hypothetical protein